MARYSSLAESDHLLDPLKPSSQQQIQMVSGKNHFQEAHHDHYFAKTVSKGFLDACQTLEEYD